jgi:hypothetical protein
MPFIKGQSGNPGGKSGTAKTTARNLQNFIGKYLKRNFRIALQEIEEMPVEKRIRIYLELMKYTIPKMGNIRNDLKFSDLSEAQLDELIETLQENALPAKQV